MTGPVWPYLLAVFVIGFVVGGVELLAELALTAIVAYFVAWVVMGERGRDDR